MSDPAAKRQRTTGSFSPASPPYHQARPSDQTKTPIVHPNTPTSPPYMSTASQPNGGSATGPYSDMTPPPSVHQSQQPSQPAPSAGHPHPIPTPGSTTGVTSSANVDSDGDATMIDGDGDAARSGGHRRSDHDREGDDSSGSLYRLCQSSHEVSRPHGSQNLFDLYSLNDLAKSVARVDPVTGEKINKLRKSYEGHIKNLQIAGKPKATKMDGKLMETMTMPTEHWDSLNVAGNDMRTALNTDFETLLDSAFGGMAPGPLPPKETATYRAYLGVDDASKSKVAGEGVANRGLPPAAVAPYAGTPQHAARLARPERAGSKRSYNETSFSGYGEGFADDYAGNSTGGEDDGQGGMSKKRRIAAFERGPHQVEVGGVRR